MDKSNNSLTNALTIMKSFSMDNPEQGVTEIAENLNIGKSTVHRLLLSLGSEGFVYKDPNSNRYSLGTSFLALTNIVNSQLPIVNESNPILNVLTERTGETSHLGIIEGKHIIYLQKIDSENPIKLSTHIGMRQPIHATSIGQIILGFQNEKTIHKLLPEKLERFTDKTITTRDQLKLKLSTIRQQQFVICDEEYVKGVISIAAPVFDEKGQVIAAVSIVGPVNRMLIKIKQKAFIEEVKSAADKLSEMVKIRRRKRYYENKYSV
ncbi:IclR family transcriptional regulator [Neobacillus sp. 3P2-tot-E-2]|uniref:IclR family transcriptional regulator n=1 Tax=Neobacillus sp. 3P2-tot-E-2 TaxID=3132212 RepID=UPI0039A383EB